MRFQLGIQIILLVVAVVIAFSVIKPKFAEIRATQNEVVIYQNALENIGKYNQSLQNLINQSKAMSSADRTALFRYLPDSIDTTTVSRDIANIMERNRMLLLDISFESIEPVTVSVSDNAGVVASTDESGMVTDQSAPANLGYLLSQTFKVEVVGTYEQMKSMLQDLERNNYPLRIVSFEFTVEDDKSTDLIQYSLTLETFALSATLPMEESNI